MAPFNLPISGITKNCFHLLIIHKGIQNLSCFAFICWQNHQGNCSLICSKPHSQNQLWYWREVLYVIQPNMFQNKVLLPELQESPSHYLFKFISRLSLKNRDSAETRWFWHRTDLFNKRSNLACCLVVTIWAVTSILVTIILSTLSQSLSAKLRCTGNSNRAIWSNWELVWWIHTLNNTQLARFSIHLAVQVSKKWRLALITHEFFLECLHWEIFKKFCKYLVFYLSSDVADRHIQSGLHAQSINCGLRDWFYCNKCSVWNVTGNPVGETFNWFFLIAVQCQNKVKLWEKNTY